MGPSRPEGWWAGNSSLQSDPSKTQVSERKVGPGLEPPKSTSFPMASSNAVAGAMRAPGLVDGDSSVQSSAAGWSWKTHVSANGQVEAPQPPNRTKSPVAGSKAAPVPEYRADGLWAGE